MFQDGSMKTILSASRIRRELFYNVHHSTKRSPKAQIRHISVPRPYHSDKQSHTLRADCFYLTLAPRYHPPPLPQLGSRSSRKQAFSPSSKVTLTHKTATEHPNNCPSHSGRCYHHTPQLLQSPKVKYNRLWFIILVFIAFLLTISSTF